MTTAATTTEIRQQLEELLTVCRRTGASDLHVAPGLPPYVRVQGLVEPLTENGVISAELSERLARELGREYDDRPLVETGSLDGAVSGSDGTRYRFNVFRRQGRYSIAIRRLDDEFRSLEELGLPDSLYKLCNLPDGLVVVAGPTGSGKSTTLATLLDRINRTRPAHIVTIEDPIEYLHPPQMSLINQRQVGHDAGSFHDALVASLRQDPDVILVGEVRELSTIRTAITAAETGHLVFTTVHAGDCVGAIERLVSVFPADEQSGIRRQLSLVLRAIVAQHLVVADGARSPAHDSIVRRRRVVVSEVLTSTPAVANLIATGKVNQVYSAMESSASQGMQTLDFDLARLMNAGDISEAAATALSKNPGLLRDRMRKAGTLEVTKKSRMTKGKYQKK